jgi:glycosyltransferase involved in cell wall biosynthesis
LRVIHIITKLELGGAQENTLYTLRHLDPRRFSGMLITHPEGILAEEARRAGTYRTVFIPSLLREVRPLSDLQALAALFRLLRREMKDGAGDSDRGVIVHTHSSKAGVLGRLAARLAGIPVIVHSIHGFGFHDYQNRALRRFYITLEKIAARWTTRFIAVSRASIDAGAALGIFPAERATLVRSGIDIDAFSGRGLDRAAKRESLGVAPGRKVVGMVACFKRQKNPVDFIRLAGAVLSETTDVEFVLAGDGELRPQVEEAVRSLGLEGKVRLLGWRRDVAEIIPSLDVLVLTSLWEGLPRVFPQAMAAAVPIVAYRVDGAPEAVTDGVNGFLVDPGDFREASRKVVRLLGDPGLAASLGRAGSLRAAEFDADRMVREQEALYERLWMERQ